MEINQMTLIISVDPGKGGAISSALFNPETHTFHMVRSVQMPESAVEINKYIGYLIDGRDLSKVWTFLENITVFQGDAKDGRMFRMQKLHKNFTQLKTMFELRGIRTECPMPTVWQTQLHLRQKGLKEESSVRKKRYKDFAQRTFPNIKVNLKNGDSLCILEWARRQMVYNSKKYL